VARIGRKARPGDLSAGAVFAQRLAEVRKARGWSQKQLAERMSEIGHPIHRVKLAKIEKERARSVTLEDVLALSYALDVSPLYMFIPLDDVGDGPALVVSGAGAIPAPEARKWMRGRELLDGQDPYVFALQMPRSDFTAFVEQHPEVVERIQRSAPYPKEQK